MDDSCAFGIENERPGPLRDASTGEKQGVGLNDPLHPRIALKNLGLERVAQDVDVAIRLRVVLYDLINGAQPYHDRITDSRSQRDQKAACTGFALHCS